MHRNSIAASAALLLAALISAPAGAAIPFGPQGDAFYRPPYPLPHQTDGAVVWAQPFSGGAALPSAAINYRIIYETTSATGAFVAVSGTLAIPRGTPPPRGWPLISWAHGTTGNAPQCAPSRSSQMNVEQRMLDGFVERGYAVAATDYEGNGTPGIHPYMVGIAAARDVTAIAKAAREIDPRIGRAWVVMGHSEGGHAALATAALGQQLAPEMQLLGVVSYAPFSMPGGVMKNEYVNPDPNEGLVILALMIAGFATVDPHVDPAQMLEPDALRLMPELESRCLDDLMRNSEWSRINPRAIFKPGGESADEAFYHDLEQNDASKFTIDVPTLLVNGVSDPLVASESTMILRDSLSRNGTPVSFKAYASATHGTVLAASENDVAAWLAQRFAATAAAELVR